MQGIKVADGQHMIESRYDKVYSQATPQHNIYDFVERKSPLAALTSLPLLQRISRT